MYLNIKGRFTNISDKKAIRDYVKRIINKRNGMATFTFEDQGNIRKVREELIKPKSYTNKLKNELQKIANSLKSSIYRSNPKVQATTQKIIIDDWTFHISRDFLYLYRRGMQKIRISRNFNLSITAARSINSNPFCITFYVTHLERNGFQSGYLVVSSDLNNSCVGYSARSPALAIKSFKNALYKKTASS